jgi:hypothetical protein
MALLCRNNKNLVRLLIYLEREFFLTAEAIVKEGRYAKSHLKTEQHSETL